MSSSDHDLIQQTIQTYFDSMYESDPAKVHEAFHPDAKITGYLNGELHEMTVPTFADMVAGQQPSAKEKDEAIQLETVSLEIAGDTAVARVRDGYIGLVFLDTLSFLKTEGAWVIYNKLFHVES
ncbi:MAG: nuclear transport factor 2 family protein [Pseudomonadales bacterium]|nr:nuclear transport factor 2 family protein [Pseudomonadales bacterium]